MYLSSVPTTNRGVSMIQETLRSLECRSYSCFLNDRERPRARRPNRGAFFPILPRSNVISVPLSTEPQDRPRGVTATTFCWPPLPGWTASSKCGPTADPSLLMARTLSPGTWRQEPSTRTTTTGEGDPFIYILFACGDGGGNWESFPSTRLVFAATPYFPYLDQT